jgi:eukaryotic-like serine/threonine-protein kinase
MNTPMNPPPPPPSTPRPPGPPSPPQDHARKVESVFIAALDILEPAKRAAFLAEACGEDATLRAEVEELLKADESQGFLSGPAVEQIQAEKEGERIGRYKLLQEIGEGGFGTVWMAEQMEPVSRRVALKIIKLGMDTREVIARFESERQALAMMDHPNIARVLDAGATDKGRPFFVMELVKGISITNYCDDAGLPTRERLALFGDVCSAINHAHQKGIIHRDIKPSNVMVTLYADKPVVKVIDFGIAKATQGKLTDKTIFTRFEQFIGTPVYMSPEQAALSAVDIDTRSDIYALGILLYELLVGKPPFDGKSLASAGYEEMRRIIREVEPVKPSSRLSTIVGEERTQLAKAHRIEPEKIGRLVEPDLDWIVMKAIEKDRARRYETANAFAQDIRRFLADEPVSASPPSAAYQFRKFARRNRAALRIAAAIAAVLVAATAVSTWQAIRATNAEKKTADTLAQVTTERDAKEQARKEAEAMANFLGGVFQSPDPTRDGREIKVVELLDRAAEEVERELVAQPARRAKLQAALGSTYLALGLPLQAIPLQEKAWNHLRDTLGPEHPDTLVAMHSLAFYHREAGRPDESLKLQEEVLRLNRKVHGPEHPETLGAMHNLANALFFTAKGRRPEALKLREELLPLFRKISGPEDPATLRAMDNLSVSYFEADRVEEARELGEEALRLFRKVLGAEHPDTLMAMSSLSNAWFKSGRRDEAIKLLGEMLALSRKVHGNEHPTTLVALHNLAHFYENAGMADEAHKLKQELGDKVPLSIAKKMDVKPLEQALEKVRNTRGPEHADTIAAMSALAAAYGAEGSGNKAIKLGEETLALARRVLPAGDARTLAAMKALIPLYKSVDLAGDAAKLEAEIQTLTKGR